MTDGHARHVRNRGFSGIAPLPDDSYTSFAHASFDAERRIFLREFREFVNRLSTPAETRAEESRATVSALEQIMRLAGIDR